MSFESSDELPPYDPYEHGEGQGDHAREAGDVGDDLPFIREDDTGPALHGAAEPLDEDIFPVNSLTVRALDEVLSADTDRMHAEARVQMLEDQITYLGAEFDEATNKSAVAERRIRGALAQGRMHLWRAAGVEGYLQGTEMLTNAVRLSPPSGEAESVLLREARVRAITSLSSKIEADVPAIIVYAPPDREVSSICHADVPCHDGFSVVLGQNSDEFVLGMNGSNGIPITDVLIVSPGAADLYDYCEPTIRPVIDVYTGEKASDYVANLVASNTAIAMAAAENIDALDVSNDRPVDLRLQRAHEVAQREGARKELLGIITAARRIETPVKLNDDELQQTAEALSEYLLDVGDTVGHNILGTIVDIGHALKYIYPPDASVSMEDYLIGKSNERTMHYRNHYVSPVLTVLQRVCGVGVDRVPPTLLMKGR